MIQISPSILAADFSRLGEEVKAVSQAGAHMIHLDVMDGHFVPNITMGPGVVKNIRPHTNLPFDVHLMISPVDEFIAPFAQAGANILTVHPEATPHIHRTLQLIKDQGCQAGVALNPGTPVEMLAPLMDLVDLVLVMTVNPGFGGQAFLQDQLPKIRAVSQMIKESGRSILLEVDGGITPETAPLVIEAGANVLVAGSSVFKTSDYKGNIAALLGE
jgi:ribulose-phosphate 3-epimerase